MYAMTQERWKALVQGEGCPFCGERSDESEFWSKVTTLSVSTLYLHKFQTYRGYAVLVFDPRHVTRPGELDATEWTSFCADLHLAQAAVERVTKPTHMNLASLGNQVPHLHWHIIPRYEDGVRWGGPIWTTSEAEMEIRHLSDEEHRGLVSAIRAECVALTR